MSDSSSYPPVSFLFQLSIDGDTAAFQEASGINMDANPEEIPSGGENRFTHKLPRAAQYTNLVLKRGLISKESSIWKWCQETLSGELDSPIKTKQVVVQLVDAQGKGLTSWTFYNAYPVKWSASDLKSTGNEVAVESLEFSYNYFETKKF